MRECLERCYRPFLVGTKFWSSFPLLFKSFSIAQPLHPAPASGGLKDDFYVISAWQNDPKNPLTLQHQGSSVVVAGHFCSPVCLRLPNLSLTGAVFRSPAFSTNTSGFLFSSNKPMKYRRHTVSAVCSRTACNHRNSRKTESRNIHSHYGFLWVWFIDRHVLSELYVISNFLNFPSTPQLFCHNNVICSEQNPANYSSARAFEAFTAVHRSIKKDNRAWVIAQALLLMASPPHSLVWGVVDGNQKQWKADYPL